MAQRVNTWQDFAQVTIETNDLDPMYAVIAGLNEYRYREWMGRFILYFILFYDAGGAASEADYGDGVSSEGWFEHIRHLASLKETKRGTERRHFRGDNALSAIDRLSSFGLTPWELLMDMYPGKPTYSTLYNRMTTKYAKTQMGPYFIWKLYDIFNVCLGFPISLSLDEAVKYMPSEPHKAAAYFFPQTSFADAVKEVADEISQYDHPVRSGKCGLAEAETILCMMKGAFWTRTHRIGDDIDDKYSQLASYPSLQKLLPPQVDVGQYELGALP